MARNAYSGDKRRREVAKKKKREEKLARKQHRGDEPEGESTGENSGEEQQDLSYLEYLYPGGVPEELLPKSEDDADEVGDEQEGKEEDESNKDA